MQDMARLFDRSIPWEKKAKLLKKAKRRVKK